MSASAPVDAPEAGVVTPRGPTTLHGTVVGHDGRPLVHTEVRVTRRAGAEPDLVVVDRRGRFSIELDHQGLASIEISAPDHAVMSFPVVLEGGSLALDVQMGTYDRPEPMATVQAVVWEGNPEESEPQVVDMALRPDGKWHGSIETKSSVLTYQLMGPATHRSVAGMQANRFDYDGGGDYRSVVYVQDGEFEFVIDPDTLVPPARRSEIRVAEADSPTDRLLAAIRPAADALTAFEDTVMAAQSAEEATKLQEAFDWSETTHQLRTAISQESQPDVRRMLIAKYLQLPIPEGHDSETDRRLAGELLTSMDADAPAWALFPFAMSQAIDLAGEDPHRARFAQLLDDELPAELAAQFLFGELLMAEQRGDTEAAKQAFARLNRPERFGETGILELAASHDPAGPLSAGRTLPQFVVEARAGDTEKLDNESLLGRVTLIDFWAPYCGPCVAEMGNLHAMHQRYGGERDGRPFQIVSISLDTDADQLREFRKDKAHAMPWRHGSTAFEAAAESFGIHAIPFAILVDEQGTILASGQGLIGDGLERELAKHLGGTGGDY
jgi:thiol-disulfide isomerase/thioredoxin